MNGEKLLTGGAAQLGIDLPDGACARFQTYYEFLTEKNKVMNLTALDGVEDVYTLHFLDCIALSKIAGFSGKKAIDIGSGAGFPGMPLKLCVPDLSLTLLDALQKRIGFLQELCDKLALEDVQCIHARAEEAAAEMRETFDFALSRAVARLSILCELCMPFVKPGGQFIAMKSIDSEEEINEAKKAISLLGGKIEKVIDYPVPGTDVVHRAVVISKVEKTPKKYPRRFANIKKAPL